MGNFQADAKWVQQTLLISSNILPIFWNAAVSAERLLIFLSRKLVLCKCSCINVCRSQWMPMIEATALEAWLVVTAVIHVVSLLLREVLSAGSQDAESWLWPWVRSQGTSQLFILTPRSLLERNWVKLTLCISAKKYLFLSLEKRGNAVAKLFSKCSKLFSFSPKRHFCKFSIIMAPICIETKMLNYLHHLWNP